ncbi:MAG: GGDEF domain-containing protein, partial [Nitrospira sp.]|nr:GGDEF domain-containing protein [Nitrospira sp.]
MKDASLSSDENERLEELRRYEVLDTAADKDIDDLTHLAAHICEVPIALVCLVDATRQWFKSKVGINASETSRTIAFCAHAILQHDVFIVHDAQID